MSVSTKRDLYSLARELSRALAASPELVAFHQAEDDLFADPGAMALIDAFEQAKKAVKTAIPQGPAAAEAALTHQMDLQDRMDRHALIRRYKQTRDNLDRLVENLNAIITFPIYGEDTPARTSGCGGGGCGGGCGG